MGEVRGDILQRVGGGQGRDFLDENTLIASLGELRYRKLIFIDRGVGEVKSSSKERGEYEIFHLHCLALLQEI